MFEWSERRRIVERRLRDRSSYTYETRRDWILAELLLGLVSCATGITGISGGLVSTTLENDGIDLAWFLCFYGSGAAFIVLAYLESRCRSRHCGRDVLVRYAHARFGVHAVNFFCWGMAFLWLHFSAIGIASIYFEAIPLAAINFAGMVEHAKALWLRPRDARTTSFVGAGFHSLRLKR